ncbi:MAG: hypothetical protein IT462_13935 [Planctomycetes bacterium]|nr:hypothetical protein [Planctomycetota bacterium]
MADWPKADGTRIELASSIKAVAGDADLGSVDMVELARSFAWCKTQRDAAVKLASLSGGKIASDKAEAIIKAAYEHNHKRVRNNKSDQDVTLGREK